jgi:hypothetical protein
MCQQAAIRLHRTLESHLCPTWCVLQVRTLQECWPEGQETCRQPIAYPPELIPFQPVDGADMQYGQLYKPITAPPFKGAGLKGFMPCQSYQLAPSYLVQIQPGSDFHWPSLSELNEEITPFPWSNDDEFRRYLADDSFAALPVMATGPPPSAPHHVIPSILAIHLLTTSIIRSIDHLFFMSHRIGSNDAREWQFVRVAFEDLISLYPSCMQDGRFLFKFYICQPPIGIIMPSTRGTGFNIMTCQTFIPRTQHWRQI